MYEILLTKTSHRFYDDADPVLVRKLHHCFDICVIVPIAIQAASGSRGLSPAICATALVPGMGH